MEFDELRFAVVRRKERLRGDAVGNRLVAARARCWRGAAQARFNQGSIVCGRRSEGGRQSNVQQ